MEAKRKTRTVSGSYKDEIAKWISSPIVAAGLELGRMILVWRKSVSEKMARAASPGSFENGQLKIIARNSIYANEIQARSEEIRKKMNTCFENEKITGISVIVGKLE